MKKRRKTASQPAARSGRAARNGHAARLAQAKPKAEAAPKAAPAANSRLIRRERRSARPPHSRATSARNRSLTLAGDCTVSEASALKARLGSLLTEARAVAIDIAALERIDTAGMQLIAAFVQHRERQGLAVEWQGTSSALSSAARLLGLAGLLKLPA